MFRITSVFLMLVALIISAYSDDSSLSQNRSSKSIRLPWPIGPFCNGCPSHFCETDPGIVLGYCCGCRQPFDILPIVCTRNIVCPIEISGVCHDYEYMLYCCC